MQTLPSEEELLYVPSNRVNNNNKKYADSWAIVNQNLQTTSYNGELATKPRYIRIAIYTRLLSLLISVSTALRRFVRFKLL